MLYDGLCVWLMHAVLLPLCLCRCFRAARCSGCARQGCWAGPRRWLVRLPVRCSQVGPCVVLMAAAGARGLHAQLANHALVVLFHRMMERVEPALRAGL